MRLSEGLPDTGEDCDSEQPRIPGALQAPPGQDSHTSFSCKVRLGKTFVAADIAEVTLKQAEQ